MDDAAPVTIACPNCGEVREREVFNVGTGPEVSCDACEWVWHLDDPEQRSYDPGALLLRQLLNLAGSGARFDRRQDVPGRS